MWIEELDIAGFKRLNGNFTFSSGLTVVTGPNEAGKSTMHHALRRAMFGFDRGERRRRRGSSDLADCKPWNGEGFGLTALIHTASRDLRVRWTFDGAENSQALELRDDATGEDLTEQVLAKHGDATLGRFLLGLDHGDYQQVCTVDQAAIHAVQESDSLVAALRRAAEVGGSDIGVDAARELLRAALGNLGVRVDTLSPNRNGALDRLKTRRSELEGLLEEADGDRTELERLESDRSAREQQHRGDERTLLGLDQELLLGRRRDLEQRLEAANRARGKIEIEESPDALVDQELIDRVEGLYANRDRQTDELAGANAQAESARVAVADVERDLSDLDSQLQALAPYEKVDPSGQEEVSGLLGRIDELTTPQPVVATTEATLRPDSTPVVVALVIAIVSLVAAIAVTPAALAGLLVAVAAYLFLRSRQEPQAGAAPATVESTTAGRAVSLERQLDELVTRLAPATDGAATDRARAYLASCQNHQRYLDLSARRSSLSEDLTRRKAPIAEQARLDRDLRGLDQDLALALADVGIDASEESARAEFKRRVDLGRRARDASVQAEEAAAALKDALGGSTLEELEEQARQANEALRSHVAEHGELVREPRQQELIQQLRTDLVKAREEQAGEIGRLARGIDELEGKLADVPNWREELAGIIPREGAMEQAAKAVKVARDELEEAAAEAHRKFAPILNRAIAEQLPSLTGERYRSARVADDLDITLEAPETGSFVSAEALSRGTQDQIYLIERLAISHVLSSAATESPPLLLDDAFAYCDGDRLKAALRMLGEEAQARQVVLFVDEQSVCESLDSLEVSHEHLELPAPPVPARV